jgi:hypothetical protein
LVLNRRSPRFHRGPVKFFDCRCTLTRLGIGAAAGAGAGAEGALGRAWGRSTAATGAGAGALFTDEGSITAEITLSVAPASFRRTISSVPRSAFRLSRRSP